MNLYDYKFTPWRGIDVVRQVSMISRLSTVGPTDCRFLRAAESTWKKPRAWNRKAASWREYEDAIRGTGAVNNQGPYVRPRVLLTVDPFADVPQSWRDDLFALMEECYELDWLVVTERAEQWHGMLPLDWLASSHPTDNWIPRNVWFGTRIRTQADADRMIPQLLHVPAKVRFVWANLRGRINLQMVATDGQHAIDAMAGIWRFDDGTPHPKGQCGAVDWLICSGGSDPMHPDWVRTLRDQAKAAGVPFWFDGWGEYAPHADRSSVDLSRVALWSPRENGCVAPIIFADMADERRENWYDERESGDVYMVRDGSKSSGSILDGRTWEEVPR